MYGVIEEIDDILKEFFKSFPIEKEISHLSKEEIEEEIFFSFLKVKGIKNGKRMGS